MRLLGIDYGEKKIGLAISDETAKFAFPYEVLGNISAKRVLNAVKKIIDKEKITRIILSQSLDFKGEPNPIMKRIENFKILLEKNFKIPVEYENETLTTKQAERASNDNGCRLKNDKVHASAAALILQSYLDKIRYKK